ncbi:TIGR02281 family clan AA aspartic protease [Thiorhodococcus mannitoliphagus]|uniref:TIGR02281 family clan AA aspartic protease n=1 Tax=Thiorhodococcus mannitoliphagus TaxID=329406 RepID=A0A6P1E491_9GAMM|nr:retropepsin-like aspartic protease [Thiorhodococcus mannitoliphagus]NEX22834.1 TIGR02281 family clan AA aspartic protease [Thiorhodococcus mannitoliphagus]
MLWLSPYRGLIALACCGLVVAWALAQTGTRGNPNPHPVAYLGASGIPEVVLEENQLNQYVTTGRINGDRIEFLVDTGSVDVAMPYRVAQALDLNLTPGAISKTGNGNVQSWSAWLESVDVGGLVAKRVKATVLPNMHGEQVLLGMSYLRHMEVILAAGKLTLRPLPSP